jgi:uncharacterized membrane protein YphA (DoxX/SURF4 family)
MAVAFLVGRILVGVFYLLSAWNHFAHHAMMVPYVAARGVPAPGAAVVLAGILLAIAGVTFLLGVLPRVGVAAVVLFFVPVTLIMHAFWADADPAQRLADFGRFMANMGLLGSSLMFLGVPRPWPYSVENVVRRAPAPVAG